MFDWFKKKKMAWVCDVCGQVHDELPRDFGWKLPDELWELPEEVRQEMLDWSTDVAYNEGRWFLRGVLYVPFNFDEGQWGWGIWVEVEEEVMGAAYRCFEMDATNEPRQPGTIANKIPGFEDSIGQSVDIQFLTPDKRPIFFFPAESEYPLAKEQREGISAERYHAVLDSTY